MFKYGNLRKKMIKNLAPLTHFFPQKYFARVALEFFGHQVENIHTRRWDKSDHHEDHEGRGLNQCWVGIPESAGYQLGITH